MFIAENHVEMPYDFYDPICVLYIIEYDSG